MIFFIYLHFAYILGLQSFGVSLCIFEYLLEVIDNGFKEVASMINEDSAFDYSPDIAPTETDEFTMIIIVGNLVQLESHFDYNQAVSVESLIVQKFSNIYGMTENQFSELVSDYKSFISRVNYPSKNVN